MLVKTFSTGLLTGIDEALQRLDEKVNKEFKGNGTIIHSVIDAVLPISEANKQAISNCTGATLERIIIFTPKS